MFTIKGFSLYPGVTITRVHCMSSIEMYVLVELVLAVSVVPAVPSTLLHGSVRPCPTQLLMILNCDYALMKVMQIMKI